MAEKDDQGGCGCLIAAGFVAFLAFSMVESGEEGGVLLLILAVVLFAVAWKIYRQGDAAKGGSARPPALPQSSQRLQLSLLRTKVDAGGTPLEVVKLRTRGVLAPSQPIGAPCFSVRMRDVTEGESHPVLTVIDDLQEEESTALLYEQTLHKLLPQGAGSLDWVEFGTVPLDALVFPRTGSRRVKVILSIYEAVSGSPLRDRPVVTAEAELSVNAEFGYLDFEKEESEAQAASLKLAMGLAAADGSIDDSEVREIKHWGEKTVKALPPTRAKERREALNIALRQATAEIRSGRGAPMEDAAIDTLNRIDEVRFKYEAYELCLHVLKADGEAHPEEMARLTKLAKRMDLDEAKVRILTDRHISELRFAVVDDASADDQILGVTPEMTEKEIRKHLNQLFKKYQARSTHDDPEVAAKANEWLERIANARVRHLG